MNAVPRVSVVIASYNYARFLPDALESVCQQIFPQRDIEIIVVDDGSTDDTRQVARRWTDRVHYHYQSHAGQGQAFNTGFEAAKGAHLFLLDADDTWHPEKISRVMKIFESHPDVGLVQHRMKDVPSALMAVNVNPGSDSGRLETRDDFLDGRLYFTGTSGLAFRRSVLQPLLPVPKELFFCADEYLYSHAVLNAPVWTLDDVLGKRRIHGENWYGSSLGSPKRLQDRLQVRAYLDERLEQAMKARNVTLSPAARTLKILEQLRDQTLLLSLTGQRRSAYRLIATTFKTLPKTSFFRFKKASLYLAGSLPGLYVLLLERIYNRWKGISHLRRRFLPES